MDAENSADVLYEFARRFLDANPVSADMPVRGPQSAVAAVQANLLYREGEFQVQMFTVPPDYVIPSHTHPNIDSFEVYVSGQIRFSHRGQFVFESLETVHGRDPSSYAWRMLRVLPEDPHGAVSGPQGARFISIQRWLNGVLPTCVSADYTGQVLDLEHLLQVTTGEPLAARQKDLDASDAL